MIRAQLKIAKLQADGNRWLILLVDVFYSMNVLMRLTFFYPSGVLCTHSQNAIGGVDGRNGWKNMKRKRKCEKKKGERLEELPDQVAPQQTDGG